MPTTRRTAPLRGRLEVGGLSRPAAPDATAHDLLGAGHPLACAQARMQTLIVHSAGVSTLAVLTGVAWLAEPDSRYSFVLGAAAVVQAVLVIALVLAAEARRDAALRLIAQGRGDLPLVAVARLRCRLLRPRRRRRLARSLDELRREAVRPLRAQLPLYSRRVVRSVDRELAQVAGLLGARNVSPDGVALTHLLLSAESSELYGNDADRLRQELSRVTFALRSGSQA